MKNKIVTFLLDFPWLTFIQFVLIILKFRNIITWEWQYVLLPFMIYMILWIVLFIISIIVQAIRKNSVNATDKTASLTEEEKTQLSPELKSMMENFDASSMKPISGEVKDTHDV